MKKIRLLGLIVFLLAISMALCHAQEALTEEQIILQKYPDLVSLNNTINYLSSEIEEKNAELSKENNDNKKAKLESEIDQLNSKLKVSKKTFANTVSDINFFSEEDEDASKLKEPKDIVKELQDLLLPFLESFKNATRAPRKIEKLRVNIENIDSKNALAQEALANIALIEATDKFNAMKENIQASKTMLQRSIEENNLLKSMYKRDLDKALKGNSTLFAVADSVNKFFTTKGRNLIIAIAAGVIVAFILKLLKKAFLSIKLFNRKERNFRKTFKALYGIFIWIVSILCSIASLYILNDWFLFSLSLLLLVAISWSLKIYIPKFITEIKLIMDLGYVKEGERIIWNNCPWIVKKLGMSVQIENEFLDSRFRILPIKEIADLYSRPLVDSEPLFPSRTGDFVMLSDGSYGRVSVQTSEIISIAISSTLNITMSVQEYLSLKPQNYSKGFQVKSILTLDYKHQKDIAEIEKLIRKDLSEMIQKNPIFGSTNCKGLIVEFKEASSSSLDIFVLVDCDGNLAPQYFKVNRLLNSMLLEICTKHNLSIPFPHMQVIMEK